MPSRRILVLFAAAAFLCAVAAYGQDDSPSLGDVARQARLQKQQKDAQSPSAPAKDAQSSADPDKAKADQTKADEAKNSSAASTTSKTAKPSHVVTNDEVPSHIGSTLTSAKRSHAAATPDEQPSSDNSSAADQWKSQIQDQKASIAALQTNIASLNDSIQYAGANCVSNCVQWNEDQKRKQDQVESMKGELEQQQKQLEESQESARQQGFGSSVYDPD